MRLLFVGLVDKLIGLCHYSVLSAVHSDERAAMPGFLYSLSDTTGCQTTASSTIRLVLASLQPAAGWQSTQLAQAVRLPIPNFGEELPGR